MISSHTNEGGSSSTPTPHANNDVEMIQTDDEQQNLNELIAQWSKMTFEDSEIPTLVQKVHSSESEDLHHGLIGLRRLLSNENQPPIQQIIDTGVVPRLVQLISPSSAKKVQLEAAWCLSNLCSGTTQQTSYVIDNGAISSFLSLLSSDDSELAEQSIWGIGNIAGDSTEFRDLILQQNGTDELVKALAKASTVSLKRIGVWALSNFCKGKPEPAFARVSKAIAPFCESLTTETDTETLTDVAWSLSYLTVSDAGIQSVLSHNVVLKLIELLSHPALSVIFPSLRVIGNIISGTNEQASVVLKEKNLIPELFKLAENKKMKIRREAFCILSKITAGTPIMLETILGNLAYVEKLIYTAKNDLPEVRKEAVWALSNSTEKCTPAQIIRILTNGIFGCLVDLLDEQDPKLLCVALEGIENCLKWGEQFNLKDESGVNKFVAEMESKGGMEKIENLQTHQSSEVYEYSFKIIETYFAGEEFDQE